MKTTLILLALLISPIAHAHLVKTPAGGILFQGKIVPEKQDLWFAESYMDQNQFKASPFVAINKYMASVTNQELIDKNNEYLYVAKVFCRIKNVSGFFDKKQFLTLNYHQKAMPTVKLSILNNDPLSMNAEADLFGLMTLTAPLVPQYYNEEDINHDTDNSTILLGITPVTNIAPKAVTVRMTGKFNHFLSRLVMVSAFYELPNNELLATTHVAVSIESGFITSTEKFKTYLSKFFKQTMVEGMDSLSL